MDPRSLIGPTCVVMALIVATLGTLFLLEPAAADEPTPEEVYSMTADEFKADRDSRVGQQMNRRLVYFAVIAVLICFVSTGRTRWWIIGVIGMAAICFTGQQAGAMYSVTMICFPGAVIIPVMVFLKLYGKAVDNGKRPAMERWAPRRIDRRFNTDSETLARLDRLRDVALLPPPRAS